MSPLPRVFLCDGDSSGWAIDEDRRLTARSLGGIVRLVDDPAEADVIHACWWEPLMRLPESAVRAKPVICHLAGQLARCLAEPAFQGAMERVTHWVAQSRAADRDLRCVAGSVTLIPYAVDVPTFQSPGQPPCLAVLRAFSQLPRGCYVVANFHRDTAGPHAGLGECAPKLVKGPDLFVEIMAELRRRARPVVALLAGPRRHWVRRELMRRQMPFVFAGNPTDGDDYPANILPRDQIAQLYRAAHLSVCTSRSEGGPRSVLEAAAAGVPQVSTPVGIAPDILHPDCLFNDPLRAVELIEADMDHGALRAYSPVHAATVQAAHTIEANRRRFADLYRRLRPPVTAGRRPIRLAPPRELPRRICLWNKFTPPPWGGGNQFMLALRAEAERQGIEVTINGDGPPPAGHIVNSVQFEVDKFRDTVEPGTVRVVHRIDGPISALRGTPESFAQDQLCFEFNRTYATATVVQSWHTLRSLSELGFRPPRAVLIHNACDPAVFFRPPTPRPLPPRLRVIASAWSPSPGKGAAIYRWMGKHLDPDRYELTFVGNTPAGLEGWRTLPPLPSAELADLLRRHDVYITASRNDPCSNALIEALSCGLPALYLDSGGHPELVSFGGLPFGRPDEIPALLERIAAHHPIYRRLIAVPAMADVCRRYLSLIFGGRADAPASGEDPSSIVEQKGPVRSISSV